MGRVVVLVRLCVGLKKLVGGDTNKLGVGELTDVEYHFVADSPDAGPHSKVSGSRLDLKGMKDDKGFAMLMLITTSLDSPL